MQTDPLPGQSSQQQLKQQYDDKSKQQFDQNNSKPQQSYYNNNLSIPQQQQQQQQQNSASYLQSSPVPNRNPQLSQQQHYPIQQTNQLIRFPKNYNQPYSLQQQLSSQSFNSSKIYPWLTSQTKAIQNPLIKLHNQIIDYYIQFQQTQSKHNYLLSAFSKFQGLIYKNINKCEVMAPFLINKVYLKNSQVQIFVLFQEFSKNDQDKIEKVKSCIEKANFQKVKFFQVQQSDTTSCKQTKIGFNCITNQQNYAVQIKIVNQQWLPYLHLLNQSLQNNLQCKYLFFIFDTMIRQRGLENSIKSYLTCGLIAVFIHERKRQKSRSLTENILKFLQYFGIGPFTQRKISFKGKGQFQIRQQNPLSSSNNQNNQNNQYSNQHQNNYSQFSFWITQKIDISNHMIKQFFSLLKNRYRLISNYNFNNCDSILYALINPCQEEFRY